MAWKLLGIIRDMKPLMFFVFTFLSFLSFGQDSTKVIAIEELEVDHPLLTDDFYKSLLILDLYDLDDLSQQKEDTVSLLFASMEYYLICLSAFLPQAICSGNDESIE